MDTAIVQKRVNDLSAAMVAKGMREPEAQTWIKANSGPLVYLKWKSGIDHGGALGNDKHRFIRATDVATALDEASTFIAKEPNAEQAKLHDFMSALGSVIDIGRKHGIGADYLNPLVASMKKLSENALTHRKPEAA